MNKKNFSRNDTKIREQKNIFIPLCSVLVICSIAGSIAYGINIKQTKELDRLEAISKTEEDRAKEYRTEVKKYFANYIGSDKAKQDILSESNIDELMYGKLESMGLINTDLISEGDMDEIIGLAIASLSNNETLKNSVDAQESTVYQTVYNDVLYKVRKNLTDSNALTVYQTVEYDTDDIIAKATSKIQDAQNKANSKKDDIDTESVVNAYVSTIVDEAIKNLRITANDETKLKQEILNQLAAYFNSEEGQKLSHQGKGGTDGKDGTDGVDGEAINLSDETVQAMVKTSYDTLLQYVLDNPKDVHITAYEGKGIDLEETMDHINVIDSSKGNKLKIAFCWNRGDWDDIQKDEQLSIEIPSFGSMKYIQNDDISTYSLDINSQDAGSSQVILSYEGKQGDSQTVQVADLAEAFAKTYTHYIYEDLRTRYIGGAEYDQAQGKYFCTVLTDPNDENSKCGTELQEIDGIMTCPTHHTKLITLDDLFGQLNKTMDSAVDAAMKTNYDFVYTEEKKATSESDLLNKADTVDHSVDILEQYVLDNYRETLRAMDYGHSSNGIYTGKSIFNAYDKAFQDLNQNDEIAVNHYGTSSSIIPANPEANPDLAKEAVILQNLINQGYIERNAAGNLDFLGDSNAEKLQNAMDSSIIRMMVRYTNYVVHDTGNTSTSIWAQIAKWEEDLKDNMRLMNLLYGKGVIFTIDTSNGSAYALSASNKETLDKYITPGTKIPVTYTIIKTGIDTANAKQNYIEDIRTNALQQVYYQDGVIRAIGSTEMNGLKICCSLAALQN